ncbi:DNA-dependent ATPase mgs1 [Rhodotorula kratochvilovae]
MSKHSPDLVMCRKQPGIAIGRTCEKCDGKCPICDSYVRPAELVRICDECNFGTYGGRCIVCGGHGISDAYYCAECVRLEKSRDGCPKIVNIGTSRTDAFYTRKAAATPDQIRAAYLRLAKDLHPDRAPPEDQAAATAQFQELARAYKVVSDPALRKAYDASLARPSASAPSARYHPGATPAAHTPDSPFPGHRVPPGGYPSRASLPPFPSRRPSPGGPAYPAHLPAGASPDPRALLDPFSGLSLSLELDPFALFEQAQAQMQGLFKAMEEVEHTPDGGVRWRGESVTVEFISLTYPAPPVCGRITTEQSVSLHLDFGCTASSSSSSAPARPPAPSSASQKKPAATAGKKRRAAPSTAADPVASSSPATRPTPSSSSAPAPHKKPRTTTSYLEAAKPLPELVRPRALEDFVGQEHLLGRGSLLRGLIEADRVGSCLFWGPPGTGKTTIARVIAKTTSSIFKELSATNATTAQLREAFVEAENVLKLTGRKTLLFIDEIQRFNKAQQDAFLPVVEAGTISLIASTTENPSFRVNTALLSRCRVFVLQKLTPDDIFRILVRALRLLHEQKTGEKLPEAPPLAVKSEPDSTPSYAVDAPVASSSSDPPAASPFAADTPLDPIFAHSGALDPPLLRFLASAADGDARVALSSLELALAATRGGEGEIDREELKRGLRKAHMLYDRTGDAHYDTISALHKSVRGGDADAALYWLARMLEGGDDPLYVARRLVRMASEDVGLVNPDALPQAVAAYQATQVIGMPECDCILAQVVVMLAESPKSVRTYKAYNAAKALVKKGEQYPVPLHIRNAPTGLMKQLGYGKEYRYNPGFAHPVYQPFLPPELAGTTFLQDDAAVDGKTVDEAALREWEWRTLGGERWEGREEMERKVRELEERLVAKSEGSDTGKGKGAQ